MAESTKRWSEMFGIDRRRSNRQKLNQAASAAEGATDILGAGGSSWIVGALAGPLQSILRRRDRPDIPMDGRSRKEIRTDLRLQRRAEREELRRQAWSLSPSCLRGELLDASAPRSWTRRRARSSLSWVHHYPNSQFALTMCERRLAGIVRDALAVHRTNDE